MDANNIREIRENLGFSVEDVSKDTKILASKLKEIEGFESLERVPIATLESIASSLFTTVNILRGKEDAANNTQSQETLGQRIKRLREERGITQAGLARLANIKLATFAYIELDANGISTERLAAIAAALNMTVEELTEGVAPYKIIRHIEQNRDKTTPRLSFDNDDRRKEVEKAIISLRREIDHLKALRALQFTDKIITHKGFSEPSSIREQFVTASMKDHLDRLRDLEIELIDLN